MRVKILAVLVAVFLLGITPNYGCGQTHKQIIRIEKKGKQGYLGVELQDVTKKLKEKKGLSIDHGAYVLGVVEDSPAEEAGIQKGDVIVKFGDENVDDSEELTNAVRAVKPKTEVKVEVNRKGEKKIVSVVVGKVKTPQAFAFDFNDDGFRGLTPPRTITKSFNVRVHTENNIQGLQTQSLTKQLGEYFGSPNGKGVLVTEVEKGSDAAESGFKAGDVITKIDNHSINDIDELREELSDMGGKETPFEIIRNGKPMKLTMKIEKDDEENDEDDMSSNIYFTPGHHNLSTFRFDIQHRFDLDALKDRLIDLREKIHRGIKDIQRDVKRELIES
jgi:C-terminal processing protease CtpA/Prc